MPDSTPPPPASTPPAAIQHAADALWPASDEANRPIRKTFAIPLNRAMGL